MAVMVKKLALLIIAVLTACGPVENEPGPGGVSAEDASALDEAAAKLDGQKPDGDK